MHHYIAPLRGAMRAASLIGATLPAAVAAQTAPPPAATPSKPIATTAPAGQKDKDATITVTGSRDGVQTSIDATSYSLSKNLQAANGTLADALRGVPSVDVDPEGNVSLRGDSSVTILIDGQPSGLLTGPSRGQTLLQLPADRFARVEVMTNPSAAYSPEGSGGVINLITKPAAPRAGTTATGSIRGAVGDRGRWTGAASGSWQRGPWTLSGDISSRYDPVTLSLFRVRELLNPATGSVVTTTRDDQEITSSQRGTVGRLTAEYRFDKNTQLTAEARGTSIGTFGRGPDVFTVRNAAGSPTAAFTRDGSAAFDVANWGGTLRMLHRFDTAGHEWTNELRYDTNDTDNLFRIATRFDLPIGADLFERSDQHIGLATLGFTSAYVRPLASGGRLRLGYELTDQRPEQQFAFRRGATVDHLTLVDALTNAFRGRQTVNALYSTYERPLSPELTAQAGLRLEQTDIRIDGLTGNAPVTQDYFRIFPTAHVEYRLSATETLRASYSRRIQRPQPGQLNSAVIFVDPLNRRSGNAELRPQETDATELTWQRRQGQGFYQATLYLRDTSRSFTDVARDIGNGLLLTRPENLGSRRDIGLDLSFNGPLLPKLRYSVGGNVFHQSVQAEGILGGEPRDAVLASGRFSLDWQPTKADFVQLSGFWVGDTLLAQGEREIGGMLNFGYRRKLDSRFSLNLTGRDLLNSFRIRSAYDTPQFRDQSGQHLKLRSVLVGLTYTLGSTPRRQPEQFDFSTLPTAGS